MNWQYWLIGSCFTLLFVSRLFPVLEAALLRNLGAQQVIILLTDPQTECELLESVTGQDYLLESQQLQPENPASWRTLLRLKGLTDRKWIEENLIALNTEEAKLAVNKGAYFLSASPEIGREWSRERCWSAYGLWTRALVEQSQGHWEQSVAHYQAGLTVAPGRMPDKIIQEYYRTLAYYTSLNPELNPSSKLAAAKYFMLAEEYSMAHQLFAALQFDDSFDPQESCVIETALEQIESGDLAFDNPPSWIECLLIPSPGSDQTIQPGWQLTQNKSSLEDNRDKILIGFDLDQDILNAGVEVMGLLYWQSSNGGIVTEDFRETNLWANSGNNWLPLNGFSKCLPGYQEPAWVSPCASSLEFDEEASGKQNPVGRLDIPQAEGPDSFVSTASALVPANVHVIYGGRWQMKGIFPRAQMTRYGGVQEENPRLYLEVVVDLSDLSADLWQKEVGITAPLVHEFEFFGWIRPQVGLGSGEFLFDDVFGFVLPEEKN